MMRKYCLGGPITQWNFEIFMITIVELNFHGIESKRGN